MLCKCWTPLRSLLVELLLKQAFKFLWWSHTWIVPSHLKLSLTVCPSFDIVRPSLSKDTCSITTHQYNIPLKALPEFVCKNTALRSLFQEKYRTQLYIVLYIITYLCYCFLQQIIQNHKFLSWMYLYDEHYFNYCRVQKKLKFLTCNYAVPL